MSEAYPTNDTPTLSERQTILPVGRRERRYILWERLPSGGSGPAFELRRDPLLIGRGEDADLQLTSTAVSRHHARLTRRDGEFTLLDLDSTHGILVNGVRVHSAELRDGDILQLADVILVYEEG